MFDKATRHTDRQLLLFALGSAGSGKSNLLRHGTGKTSYILGALHRIIPDRRCCTGPSVLAKAPSQIERSTSGVSIHMAAHTLWRSFIEVMWLIKSYRQANEDQFLSLLLRTRNGVNTAEDWNMLITRFDATATHIPNRQVSSHSHLLHERRSR